MGNFLAQLVPPDSPDAKTKVPMLGLDNAGKSTILKRFFDDPTFVAGKEMPIQGFTMKTATSAQIEILVWDEGSRMSLRAFKTPFLEGSDALIWVVDSADRRRAEESGLELLSYLQYFDNKPVLILSNKSDLLPSASNAEVAHFFGADVSEDGTLSWPWDGPTAIFSVCAKNGDGFEPAWAWLAEHAPRGENTLTKSAATAL
mmetsp:Transcript_29382/g.68135  ORF Transcript_29382/g.68135 Transcript_29382/m.68135 type:complete len:202 (-) Transcript_29382:79-684(-)